MIKLRIFFRLKRRKIMDLKILKRENKVYIGNM